ncbi:alpha/beta fold hydrolase [Allosalinactinospora lopnorensis]|uniref:alpha/beta fold hydrolase n=1 Tax=Allosalinactinospora lopnorensis TaxID=1352348 RepID=UPI0009E58EDE|nr:alpha/beta hydrolase [Allosalinactinospora lopnorensis]
MDASRDLVVAGTDSTAITVTDQGRGPAVLLVHGGSGGPADWAGVAAPLSEHFRVLRFQRFTYRREPPPAGADAMAGEVGDVLAVADAIDGPLLLVGHSSGGVVALESALAAPSRFAGMVLYEPPVAVTEPLGGEALRRARRALDAGGPDRAVAVFLRDIVQVPAPAVTAMRLPPPVWRRMRGYAPAQIADTEAIESLGVGLDRYSGLDMPVLLLGGGRLSPAHLRPRMDALAGVLPHVDSLVVLRRRGHGAHVSAPGTVARTIASFAGRVMG